MKLPGELFDHFVVKGQAPVKDRAKAKSKVKRVNLKGLK
jgi:hypothetical protein